MLIESKVMEVILSIGLSIISYFLKLIHSDLRELLKRVQTQETQLAVNENRLNTIESRIEKLEETNV